jgi:pimeloyl-ACP methyl ester carboxylesterase
MPLIRLNGQEIHYVHNKIDDGGPTLVLVHGAGGRIQSWPIQWQETRYVPSARGKRWISDFPIYIVDLPGHGRSPPPGRTSITDYAADIIAFTEAVGIKRAVIAGHSMGGTIAQQVAWERPSNLAAIILIGTGAHMPVTDLILDGLLTDFPKTVDLITKFSWHRDAADVYTAGARRHMLDTNPRVVHGDFAACNNFDFRERLSNITTPTLVIGGDTDKMMPLANSQFLADHIPQAQLVVIANAGHYMMTEKTASVSKAIVPFLNQLSTKS